MKTAILNHSGVELLCLYSTEGAHEAATETDEAVTPCVIMEHVLAGEIELWGSARKSPCLLTEDVISDLEQQIERSFT